MLAPKLILSPIDFSDASLEALQTATDIASKYGSEILLIHAVPVIPTLPPGVSILSEGPYAEKLIGSAEQHLADLASGIQQKGVRTRTRIGLANDAAMEIIRAAESEKVDLIVIATHGMTGWRRLAFGSVTEKVVRTANCPVLVIRAPVAAKPQSETAESEPAVA